MTEFFSSAHAIDLVLLLIGLEAVGLVMLWRKRRCPLHPLETLLILAPGTCLLLAARAAINGAAWSVVSLLFLVALVIHLIDLWQRWYVAGRREAAKGRRGA
jgi:hypothetical protein